MSAVQGSKGSKPHQAPQRTPVEAANTLRSVSKGRILDLIQHGPIYGLADGLKSVFLDDTPLQNADDSFNFSGVSVTTRLGYPDQEVIPGFRSVENPRDVSTEIKFGYPVVRAVSNNDADAVVVTVRVNALSKQDESTGDLRGHAVSVSIHTRVNGGAWTSAVYDTISGKTTSPYQRSYRVNLPSSGEWEIKVVRESPDESGSYSQSATFWADMTEVVDARLNYPDCALVGIEVDASLFGNQMPSRSYDMKLSIIKVPSNYDPVTREYTGIWNGSFKLAWSDNPAWCYYDLATHPVIGAGLTGVDKWALYQIGRYCDELVPDGFGGMEPRFTLNTLFAERTEAITTLSALASVFRGMTYWGTNTVVPVGDMPKDPVKLVGPANVVDGEFEYSGTSLKERHSVAVVMWNDPSDSGKAKPELVEDPESIELFGWREVQLTAFGCTSRGQANRLGRWILYSERKETETIRYTAVADQADLRPGDIIEVSDPDRAGARLSGRVSATGTSELTLDRVPSEVTGSHWFISVMMSNGVTERRQVSRFTGNVATLESPLPSSPLPGAMWILSSISVVPQQYRVASVSEQEEGTYEIFATEYDPRKYLIVEHGVTLPDLPTSLVPTGPIAPALDITAKVYTYLAGGTEHQGLSISWTPSSDVRVERYVAEVQSPADVKWRTAHHGPGVSFDEKDAPPGQWMIRVKALSSYGVGSAWVSRTVNVAGLLLPVAPDRVDVSEATFSIALYPRGAYPGAMYEFWRSLTPLVGDQIESNAVRLSVSTDLVDTGLKSDTQYYYYVRGANAYGVSDWFPVQGKTKADFDDIVTALDADIRKPGGLFEDMVNEVGSATAVAEAQATAEQALDTANSLLSRVNIVEDGVTVGAWQDKLSAVKFSALVSQHEGSSSRATVEEQTRVTEDTALSARITEVSATVAENHAAVTERLVTIATTEAALASKVDQLTTKVGNGHEADIQLEQVARVAADDALAIQILTLTARVNEEIEAQVTVESLARAQAQEALAQQVTKVSADLEEQSASITQRFTAQTDYTDGAVARAVTTATVNGKKAVFGISVNGEVSEIGAIADRFYVYNPVGGDYTLAFAVVDGKTVIKDAMIRDASITSAKIADLSVTMAKIGGSLQSDNYVPGLTGWRLTRAGQFEINGEVAGGGRTQINNKGVKIYDKNNVLRIEMGELSV